MRRSILNVESVKKRESAMLVVYFYLILYFYFILFFLLFHPLHPHPRPQVIFADRSTAVLRCSLLFLSLYVFACMSWDFFFILDSRLANVWERNCLWLSACRLLIVVPLF